MTDIFNKLNNKGGDCRCNLTCFLIVKLVRHYAWMMILYMNLEITWYPKKCRIRMHCFGYSIFWDCSKSSHRWAKSWLHLLQDAIEWRPIKKIILENLHWFQNAWLTTKFIVLILPELWCVDWTVHPISFFQLNSICLPLSSSATPPLSFFCFVIFDQHQKGVTLHSSIFSAFTN